MLGPLTLKTWLSEPRLPPRKKICAAGAQPMNPKTAAQPPERIPSAMRRCTVPTPASARSTHVMNT
eukprot:364724-Chlamydomonas_euryale.AAC.2